MIASHSERVSGHRLQLVDDKNNGMGVFEDLDCHRSRITCPIHPDFVIPFLDRGEVIIPKENKNDQRMVNDVRMRFASHFGGLADVDLVVTEHERKKS